MALLPSETRASIRTALARAVGALELSGVVTTSPSSTTITSADAIYVSDDALNGMQIVIKSGTGAVANCERLISDFAQSSDTITVARAWATNPAVADTYDIYRTQVADKALLDDAIKYAIELVQDKFPLEWEDVVSLRTQSIIKNGGVMDWLSGTASAPDNWLLSGASAAVAQDTTYLRKGPYSAKLTNGASQAAALQASFMLPWHMLGGLTVTFGAWVYFATAARCTLTVFDGTTTTTDTHDGGGWDYLECTATLAAEPTEVTAKLNITTGTQLSAYLAEAFFEVGSGTDVTEYYLSKRLHRISEIILEGADDYKFVVTIPQSYWYPDMSRETLVIDPRKYQPAPGLRMKVIGQTYQKVPDSDSELIYLPMAYLVAQARAYIQRLRNPGQAWIAEQEALRLRRQLKRTHRINARIVR